MGKDEVRNSFPLHDIRFSWLTAIEVNKIIFMVFPSVVKHRELENDFLLWRFSSRNVLEAAVGLI